MRPTVVMVVGDPDYKKQSTRVPAQLAAMREHYGDVVLVTMQGTGPSYVASAWACSQGVYFAELPNLRGRYGVRHDELAGMAMLALRPDVCVSFGYSPQAELARRAGITTYEL